MKLKLIGTGSIGAIQSSACTLVNDDILIDMPNGIVKWRCYKFIKKKDGWS